MTRFKQALLVELVEHAQQGGARHPARTPRRRLPRLVAAFAAVAVVITAAFALLVGPVGEQPAYAVVKHGDGTVSITFRELADPQVATRDLRAAGLRAQVLRLSEPGGCPAPAGSGAPWQMHDRLEQLSEGMMSLFTPASDDFPDEMDYVTPKVRSDDLVFSFTPAAVPREATVLLVEYRFNGAVVIGVGLVRIPAPTCWEIDPNIR